MPKDKNSITQKQKKFVELYMISGKAVDAYVQAGYKESSAQKNAYACLQRKAVKEYLEKLQKKESDKFEIDRDWMVKEYLELINSCKKEGHDGTGIIKDRASWNKALAQLAKLLGLDSVQELNVNLKVEQPLFGPLDDEDEEIED